MGIFRRTFLKKQIDGQMNFFDFITETKFFDEFPQFIECNDCWCYDCKHNEKNEAIPRDFTGEKKPCPACRFCMDQKKAEKCEIGSYKNGCRLRAVEEGISPE